MQPAPVLTLHRISEAARSVSYWIRGYGCPLAMNGPAYWNAVGWFAVPSGQEFGT